MASDVTQPVLPPTPSTTAGPGEEWTCAESPALGRVPPCHTTSLVLPPCAAPDKQAHTVGAAASDQDSILPSPVSNTNSPFASTAGRDPAESEPIQPTRSSGPTQARGGQGYSTATSGAALYAITASAPTWRTISTTLPSSTNLPDFAAPPDPQIISASRKRSLEHGNQRQGQRRPGEASYRMAAQHTPTTPQTPHSNAMPALLSLPQALTQQQQYPQTPSLQFFLPKLDAYTASFGGAQNLTRVEEQRICLLREACNQEDSFYLCLHQMYCLASRASGALQHLGGFGPPQYQGFGPVAVLLIVNEELPPRSLQFFVNFPVPFDELVAGPTATYRESIGQVQDTLALLGLGWHTLQMDCAARGYPPFVDDLVARFRLISPVCQEIIFMAVHRNLVGPDTSLATDQAVALFRANQQSFKQRILRQTAGFPTEVEEIQRENEGLAQEYYRILQSFRLAGVAPDNGRSRVMPQRPTGQQSIGQQPPRASVRSNSTNFVSNGIYSPQTTFDSPENNPMGHHPPIGQPQNVGAASRATMPPISFNHHPEPPTMAGFQVLGHSNAVPSHSQFNVVAPGPGHTARRRGRPPGRTNYQTRQLPQVDGSRTGAVATSLPLGSRANVPASGSVNVPAYPAATYPQTAPRNGVVEGGQRQTIYTRLLPPPDQSLVPIPHPQPSRVALHQAHLRSPPMRKFNEEGDEDVDIRYYQYLHGFALMPQQLHDFQPTVSCQLSVSDADFSRKAVDIPPFDHVLGKRCVSNGSKLYRLRCVRLAANKTSVSGSEWVVADTFWPTCFYPEINGYQLEVRRKQHHNKDLPLDLTPYICKGENTIGVTVLRATKEERLHVYAIAVEVIEVGNHATVFRAPQPKQAFEILSAITKSLKPSVDDDDLIALDEHTTINVTDPYTARMFEIPVRGKTCVHRECFDLATFLHTRKPGERVQNPTAPTSPDEWKCPICGSDARPHSLIIDGFLQDVRGTLQQNGLLDTKAILVKADGSWTAKEEKRDDFKDGREGSTASQGGSVTNGMPMTHAGAAGPFVVDLLDV